MNDVGDVAELRQDLFDERRPAATDVAVESLADVGGASAAHNGPGHVGPTDSPTPRLHQHVLEVQLHAEAAQAGHHLAPTPDSVVATALEELFERSGFGRQEVAEHVHLAPGGGRGELASADHPEAEALTRGGGGRNAGHGVVVREGDGAESGGQGAHDDDIGRQAAVGRGGMDVQVDRRASKP